MIKEQVHFYVNKYAEGYFWHGMNDFSENDFSAIVSRQYFEHYSDCVANAKEVLGKRALGDG